MSLQVQDRQSIAEMLYLNNKLTIAIDVSGKDFSFAQSAILRTLVNRISKISSCLLPNIHGYIDDSGSLMLFTRKDVTERFNKDLNGILAEAMKNPNYKNKNATINQVDDANLVRTVLALSPNLVVELPTKQEVDTDLSRLNLRERITYKMLEEGLSQSLNLFFKNPAAQAKMESFGLNELIGQVTRLEGIEKPVTIAKLLSSRVIQRNLIFHAIKVTSSLFEHFPDAENNEMMRKWSVKKIIDSASMPLYD